MRGAVRLGAAVWLLATGSAQAFTLGKPVSHGWLKRHPAVETAGCPVGVPVQTITVVNQANARPSALARVERAVVDQSVQLRAAWGTPCVQFGPGGWLLYLKVGDGTGLQGWHAATMLSGPAPGQSCECAAVWGPPYAHVLTGGSPWRGWSVPFSHEIVEMLVNPTTMRGVYRDGESQAIEVADPVTSEAYRLNGVWVSDFVLPSWFATCDQAGCTDPPYDHMGTVAAPWMSRQ